MNYRFYFTLSAIFLFSCGEKESPENDTDLAVPFKTDYKISNLETAGFFENTAHAKGKVALKEGSGLAYSRQNPGFIWTIQDKGNSNIIYLIDAATGENIAEYQIKNTKNRDWEDIEISVGPLPGKSYLYIGDTGDNNLEYEEYVVYRFEEPKFEEAHRYQSNTLEIPIDQIVFEYPRKSHDVETLMVDPLTKDIFLVTKRDLFSLLYTLPYPQHTDKKNKAVLRGTFSFRVATAGTVSEDGGEVLIKTYDKIFYWKRSEGQSFPELLATVPLLAPYEREVQGEAICFDEKGGYFTLSEWSDGIVPELNYYRRK
ncbi:hypothetical protein MMU07_14755 [Aquiflexum sp. LQ15W]|uniref:hypothetical protein n=1 Tax=Cognataquiflexum nitidum TaxID=2922272 RepID=UPI001F13E5C7|nr:hypothetical protein [Cognataquiflexum nitidum]MCH6200842.1 hypothetical protein [Cognataquiflexum nitidum]